MGDEAAGARLKQAWLRRDEDALDHLFSYCGVPATVLPRVRLSSETVDLKKPAPPVRDEVHEAFETMQGRIVSAVPDAPPGLPGAILATGLYYKSLLGWEATDNFDDIGRFVQGAQAAMDDLLSTSRERSVALARRMLGSVPLQCDTEEARLCACSYSLECTAEEVVEFLGDPVESMTGLHPTDDLLLDLLRRDHETALRFYERLTKDVAPLTMRFTDALIDQSGRVDGYELVPERMQLRTDIRAIVPELEAEAATMTAQGEVLGGELAVQADALERMAQALDQPALLLDRGRLVYVFPFTLDESVLLGTAEEHEETYDLELHKAEEPLPFRFRTITRTDAWDYLAEGAEGVFGKFHDRGQLILGHGFELRFRPKWVEMAELRSPEEAHQLGVLPPGSCHHVFSLRIVLGAHGGHYIVLETRIGDGEGNALGGPWCGADIDQWVRRLSSDAGPDQITLYRDKVEVATWDTLHECASDLAVAVDRAEHPDRDRGDEADAKPDVDFAGASVVFQVSAGRILEADGRLRPLEAGEDLSRLVGYSALLAKARYLPASVEEWIRLGAPELENLLEDLRPFGDVLLVNGEVLLLVTLGSPNWVVIEQVEILEFTVSIRGYLEHLGDDLRETLRRRDAEKDRRWFWRWRRRLRLREVKESIRKGSRVLELLRARGLMRSRYHAELLERIFLAIGTPVLDARVEHSVQDLTEIRREMQDDRLNLTLIGLTIVSLFTAFHAFGLSFLPEDPGISDRLTVAWMSAGATAIIGTLAIVIHMRRRE